MRPARLRLLAVLLLWTAVLAGCGKEEGMPSPGASAPPAPEVFESPRLFLHVGQTGQVYASLGRSVHGGQAVAAYELGLCTPAAKEACLAKFKGSLQWALGAIEPHESPLGGEPLTLQVIAAPSASWRHVLWMIMSANVREQKSRRLDLRLPQDQSGSPIQSTRVRSAGPARTRIEVGCLTGIAPTRTDPISVRVGAAGPFILSAEGVQHPGPFGRLRDELAKQRAEDDGPTAATIVTPPPISGGGATPYIDVLRVVRICRELGYEDIAFADTAFRDPAFRDPARPSSK